MSELPKADIRALAALSRIEVADDEIAALEADLSGILAFVEEIRRIEVSPPHASSSRLHNVMREDADPHEPGVYTEALLAAAPKRSDDFVEVQQVLAHVKKNAS